MQRPKYRCELPRLQIEPSSLKPRNSRVHWPKFYSTDHRSPARDDNLRAGATGCLLSLPAATGRRGRLRAGRMPGERPQAPPRLPGACSLWVRPAHNQPLRRLGQPGCSGSRRASAQAAAALGPVSGTGAARAGTCGGQGHGQQMRCWGK